MKRIYLTVLLMSSTIILFAQNRETPEKVIEEKALNKQDSLKMVQAYMAPQKDAVASGNATPYGNSAFSNVVSNISLSSLLNDGESAKVELKYTAKTNSSDWWFTPGITVDQKLGKNDKKATFYDFNKGISPGTTIGLNLQAIYWDPRISKKAFDTFDRVRTQYVLVNKNVDTRYVTYLDIMKNGTEEMKKALKLVKLKTPIFFNLKFSLAKTKFSYATDSVSLKKTEETHLSPDLGVAVGFPISSNNFLAFSYIYSESYESADELSFSRKFGTTSNTFSETLAFGKPSFKKDHKIIGEFRQNFGEKAGFAIAPSIAYGLSSKKAAFTLPIYFIPGLTKDSKPNGLQGGVNIGYVTSTDAQWSKFKDGFGAQLVVSAPFSIFGSMF